MDARQRRSRFSDELKMRHPEGAPLAAAQALPLVRAAMSAIGVTPATQAGMTALGLPDR
jgi:hypothetical protein